MFRVHAAMILASLMGSLVGQPAPKVDPAPPVPSISIVPAPGKLPRAGEAIKLTAGEFEFLSLQNYKGPIAWDVTTADGSTLPVRWFDCDNRSVVIGVRAGAGVPDSHVVPNAPTIAVFGTGTGRATVSAWGVEDGKPKKLATLLVDSNVGPRPPPKPDPDPIPVPLPDGKLGLVKASREGAAKVPASTAKATEAAALARAQRSHASAVAAGAFGDDAAKFLAGWRAANKTAVDAAVWNVWGAEVSARLAVLHAGGKLTTRADWSAAFNECADGLGGN